MAVNNASGLELASFHRGVERVADFADSSRFCDAYVATGPALLIAKSYKVVERLDVHGAAAFATRTSATCGG